MTAYMLRAPLSLEKMTYLPDAGMVMYRFHMHKGLKRDFQLMPGAQCPDLPGCATGHALLRRRELIARQFTTRLAPIAPAEGCAGGAKLT